MALHFLVNAGCAQHPAPERPPRGWQWIERRQPDLLFDAAYAAFKATAFW
jgi:hypothetical protein